MAQEIVGIKIQVGGQEKVLSSMGEIRKELKSAQFDVLKFSEAFGASSKEAIEAAKRVAQLKDAIGDAKDLVGAFNPDAKFKALSGSIQGVAGGFAALQGALGLVGVEGENVQKTLLKVQSALALSEGLNSVMGSIDAFKNLGAVIKNTVVNAFSTLRGAIIATGIGALAVGLGLVAANFEKVKTAVLNVFPGLGKLASLIGGLVEDFTDFVGITSEAERALDNLQKSTKIRNEGIERQIKLLTAQGGKEKEIAELQKQAAQNEIDVLNKKADKKGKLYGEDAKKYKDLQNEIAVIDAKESKRKDDLAKENKKKGDDASKAAREKRDKEIQERADAEKQAAEQLAKLRSEAEVLAIEDEYKAKRVAVDNQLMLDIAQVNANEKLKADTKQALTIALGEKAQNEINKINKDQADEQAKKDKEALLKKQEEERQILEIGIQARIEQLDRENAKYEMDFELDLERLQAKNELLAEQEAIELENTELTEFQKTEIRKKYADARAAVADQEVQVEKAAQQAKVDLNNKYLDLYAQFGGLLQQVAGKNKALAIAGLLIEKGAAVAKIITQMNTVPAILPPGIPNPAYIPARIGGALSIASVLAASVQGIAAINSAGSGSSGGGGSVSTSASAAAPIAPTAPIQNTVTQLDSQSINQMGNATNRAYVIESDVTNSQERIKRINRAARLT